MNRTSPSPPSLYRPRLHSQAGGFTLVEVIVAAGLIVLVLVGIYTMQAQAMQLVRDSRNASSASQMMQQRIEQLRSVPYASAATSSTVLAMMQGATGGTQAEREMLGVTNLVETVTIFPYYRPLMPLPPALTSFTITRSNNAATGPAIPSSLAAQPQIKAALRVSWNDRNGTHRREFTTVLSNGGLSASGISTKP